MSMTDRPAPLQAPELEAFRKAINQKYDAHIDHMAKGDLKVFLDDLFADDAIWRGPFPVADTVVRGRAQFEEFFYPVFDCHVVDPLRSIYTFVKGDMGFDCCIYRIRPKPGYTGPKQTDHIRFHCTFNWVRTDDGDWKVQGVTSYQTPVENENDP